MRIKAKLTKQNTYQISSNSLYVSFKLDSFFSNRKYLLLKDKYTRLKSANCRWSQHGQLGESFRVEFITAAYKNFECGTAITTL